MKTTKRPKAAIFVARETVVPRRAKAATGFPTLMTRLEAAPFQNVNEVRGFRGLYGIDFGAPMARLKDAAERNKI